MKFGEKNIGSADKAVRVVVGLAMLAAIVMGWAEGIAVYVAALLAIAMFATAAFGTCGLYSLLGVNTCEVKKR